MVEVVHEGSSTNTTSGSATGPSLLGEIVGDGAPDACGWLRAKVTAYVAADVDEVHEHGHRLVVRNGHHAEPEVTAAAGAVPVQQRGSTTSARSGDG